MLATNKRMTAAALAAAALALGGVAAGSASAAGTTTPIHPSDVAGDSNTSGTGDFNFLRDGVHIVTKDQSSESTAGFVMDQPLAQMHQIGLDWDARSGSTGSPSQFYGINDDDDPAVDGYLIGETAYGGTNVWLSSGADPAVEAAAPQTTGCPSGTSHGCGDLDDWAANLPGATVVEGGWMLSGLEGEGVLYGLTYGNQTFSFSKNTQSADVTGGNTVTTNDRTTRTLQIDFNANQTPRGYNQGDRLRWKVRSDGVTVFYTEQNAGDHDTHSQVYKDNGRTHQVEVFKNGVRVRNFKVFTK